MCNKKVRLITAIIVASSVLMFSGCGKDASTTEPVISDAVEETEPTEEPDEKPEPEVPKDTMESDTASPGNTNTSETTTEGNSSIGGEDTKTDEEIEAELEEMEEQQVDSSTSTDGKYDGGGVNLETGEYDPYHDTNNGQGWDINGEHFDNAGEYDDYLRAKLSGIPVDEEPEWWTPDQGPLTPNN